MKRFTLIATFLLLARPIFTTASTETELCRYSEYGQDTCIQKLTAFLETTPEGPLSDQELNDVYGCLTEKVPDQPIKTDPKFSDCP